VEIQLGEEDIVVLAVALRVAVVAKVAAVILETGSSQNSTPRSSTFAV
jgi:hypothetical protein